MILVERGGLPYYDTGLLVRTGRRAPRRIGRLPPVHSVDAARIGRACLGILAIDRAGRRSWGWPSFASVRPRPSIASPTGRGIPPIAPRIEPTSLRLPVGGPNPTSFSDNSNAKELADPNSRCGFGNHLKVHLGFLDLPMVQVPLLGGPNFPPASGLVRHVRGRRPERSQLPLWQISGGRSEPAGFDVDLGKPRRRAADWDRPHEFSRQTRGGAWMHADSGRVSRRRRPIEPGMAVVRNEANRPEGRRPERSQPP